MDTRRSWRALWVGLLALPWLGVPAASARPQDPPPRDPYEVKAEILYKITPYIEWPPSAFEGANRTFRVGHVGKDVFAGALERNKLDKEKKERKVNNLSIEVLNFGSVDEVRACHLLFVSELESEHLARLSESLKGSGTLIVAETAGAVRKGAVINFVIKDKNVRLQVNPDAAARQSIRISSNLLRLKDMVEVVRDGGE